MGTSAAPVEGRQFRRDRGGLGGEHAIAGDVYKERTVIVGRVADDAVGVHQCEGVADSGVEARCVNRTRRPAVHRRVVVACGERHILGHRRRVEVHEQIGTVGHRVDGLDGTVLSDEALAARKDRRVVGGHILALELEAKAEAIAHAEVKDRAADFGGALKIGARAAEDGGDRVVLAGSIRRTSFLPIFGTCRQSRTHPSHA